MRRTDSSTPTRTTSRRRFLQTGLLVAGGAVAPIGTTAAPTDATHRFEIRAADDVEFQYHFKAAGPVESVTHPEDGRGAEPGGNDAVERLPDGEYRVSGTTGLGANDVWRFGTLTGLWVDAPRDDYALFVDGDEFSWYGLDTRIPVDSRPFEVRAADHAETFDYEFVAITNATNTNNPPDKQSELFGNDYVRERDDGTTHVRGATGEGESDLWVLGWGAGDPEIPVAEFETDASPDEYTLVLVDEELSPDAVS